MLVKTAQQYNIFYSIFNLIILTKGPAQDSLLYFKKSGFLCPIHSNPSDYYMQIMHREYMAGDYKNRLTVFFDTYETVAGPIVEKEIGT